MRKAYILFLFYSFASPANAQHCGIYDYSALCIVRLSDSLEKESPYRLFLCDSSGSPLKLPLKERQWNEELGDSTFYFKQLRKFKRGDLYYGGTRNEFLRPKDYLLFLPENEVDLIFEGHSKRYVCVERKKMNLESPFKIPLEKQQFHHACMARAFWKSEENMNTVVIQYP